MDGNGMSVDKEAVKESDVVKDVQSYDFYFRI